MSRLYAVESTPATTGAAADHRLPLRPDEILRLTRALAAHLGVGGSTTTRLPAGVPLSWLNALVDDLQNYRPRGGGALVVPGMCTSPEVHALAHQINAALGSIGTTVQFIEPPGYGLSAEPQSLATLVDDMQAEQVDLLVILDGNPVYNAPTELDFAAALEKVSLIVHHSLYEDETSERCRWHLPATHPLESWSDAWAYDGTASIIQPLIAPLYDGRTAHEVLAMILESPERSNYDIVQSHWRNAWGDPTEPEFNTAWRTALHDGLVAGSASEPVEARPTGDTANSQFSPAAAGDGEFQLLLRPDPSVWDGSLANNGWLQELPRPLTKLTWDNAALVSPATAERLTLEDEQVVEITAGERSLQAPVLVLPGQADDCVTLHLGYGRTRAGRVGTDCGVDAYPLRTSSTPWNIAGVTLRKTGDRYPLARTQHHHLMDGRDLVRSGLLAALAESPEHPEFMHSEHHAEEMSFYPEVEYNGNKWAMTVDLGACNGCNACVVACQAENNIPVVGKEQVRLGREMQWLRIDHYYEGEPANPVSHHQPVMCMHCEHAPCEIVCPVAATSHTDDGLNAMVYNRCVGTRYCSNNCPYKVRRFNFLQYSDKKFPVLELLNNPQVTVRDRGVMEKCTYCVQRISTARIDAERERRPIADGEVRTACQAACPSQAINFGDLNDEQSQVAALDHSPIRYGLLEELNTRPRTTYLADVRNPNPSIT
jgi:molybdopterin-containing oxidoreductase family iron-sulfur binding subunit